MSSHTDPVLATDCTFGHREDLGMVSLEVLPGEMVAVTGGNGTGKTTLISTIAGELEPREGTVRVHTDSGHVDPASPEGAGTVLHVSEPSFFPDLTIGEHVSLMAHHADTTTDALLVDLDRWEIDSLLGNLPSQLSSGQRQRSYLGIQLTQAGALMTLDEPERHLDAAWVGELCRCLRQRCDDGSSVIVATHSPQVAETADRVITL